MKIVFFGTSNVALPILQTLVNHHEIAAVVTQPDAPVGRRQEFSESPVSVLADELQLKVLKPESVKGNDLFRMGLEGLGADVFIVVAYGKILPADIINLPKLKTLNVHFSMLPKYRGASPIQSAILKGDAETGTSIMLIDEKLDHGPVLAQKAVTIDSDDNAITLGMKLSQISAELLMQTLPSYEAGQIIPKEQDHQNASYSKIISKADGKIDWTKSAQEIYNQFRAYYPWPGVWTTWNGKTLKLQELQKVTDLQKTTESGSVVEHGIVFCGDGNGIKINRLQLEGKTETDIQSFLNGYKEFTGSRLE
jgi:methionyl-tRNA formyltransferase